jgi:hypothetical protein
MMSTASLGRVVASLPWKVGRLVARKEFSALVSIEDEFPGYVLLNLDSCCRRWPRSSGLFCC